MLVAQVSTQLEARAALCGGAELIAIGIDAQSIDAQASMVDDLRVVGAHVWIDLGRPAEVFGRDAVIRAISTLTEMGVDGLVAHDAGTMHVIEQAHSALPVAAGLGLAVWSQAGRELLAQMGFTAGVVSPQLNIGQIARLAQNPGLALAAYVHGRLDITAPSVGRVGAWEPQWQNERWRLVDSTSQEGSASADGYLLNLKYLSALKALRQLWKSGVRTFIVRADGMGPRWTHAVCRVYRQEIDRVIGGGKAGPSLPQQFHELSTTFNTGLGTGFYMGNPGMGGVTRNWPGDVGTPVGKVVAFDPRKSCAEIALTVGVCAGDVLEIRGANQACTRVTIGRGQPAATPGQTRIRVNLGGKVRLGDSVFRVAAPDVRWDSAWPEQVRVELEIEAALEKGGPLKVAYKGGGCEVRVSGSSLPVKSDTIPVDCEWLSAQLGRMGNEPFVVSQVHCSVDPGLQIPAGDVNAVRRAAITGLKQAIVASRRRSCSGEFRCGVETPAVSQSGKAAVKGTSTPRIIAIVTGQACGLCALEAGIQGVCLDCDASLAAMDRVFDAARCAGAVSAFCSMAAVNDDLMTQAVNQMRRASDAGAELLVVQDIALIPYALELQSAAVVVGPDCGVASDEAAHALTRMGAAGIVGCSPGGASAMAVGEQGGVLVGGRPLVGLSEHCVVGSELGRRTQSRQCSAPCRNSTFILKAAAGGPELVLQVDAACRMRMFGREFLLGRKAVGELIGRGYRWLWLDLRACSESDVTRLCGEFSATVRTAACSEV